MNSDAANYELLYSNRAAVPEYQSHFDSWAAKSELARRALNVEIDVPYGDDRMETMDIFRPRGESRALLMFIHGGYWRSLDKKDHSFVAAPYVNAGVTVATVNYSLCPAVKVEDIVLQCLKAAAWLYRNTAEVEAPRNRIFVAGHSAGGHLAAMCLAAQWPRYSRGLPEKVVQGAVSVSGIYDLVPISRTPSINIDLRLTEAEAMKLSPAYMPPATKAPLLISVGGREIGGFKEQHALIANRWSQVLAGDIPCPEDNHFTILNTFANAESGLCKATLRMMGI
jgi:arylformamidase